MSGDPVSQAVNHFEHFNNMRKSIWMIPASFTDAFNLLLKEHYPYIKIASFANDRDYQNLMQRAQALCDRVLKEINDIPNVYLACTEIFRATIIMFLRARWLISNNLSDDLYTLDIENLLAKFKSNSSTPQKTVTVTHDNQISISGCSCEYCGELGRLKQQARLIELQMKLMQTCHDGFVERQLIIESEDKVRTQLSESWQEETIPVLQRERQNNPDLPVISKDPMTCGICQNRAINLILDGGSLCCLCLLDYLESESLQTVPVYENPVAGIFSPFSQRKLLVVSKTVRLLSKLTDQDTRLDAITERLERDFNRAQREIAEANSKKQTLAELNSAGPIELTINQIECEILTPSCPNCCKPFVSDGCEAVTCVCGVCFCGVCLDYFSLSSGKTHEHVLQCNGGNYYLRGEARAQNMNQRSADRIREFFQQRKIDDTSNYLAMLTNRHPELARYFGLDCSQSSPARARPTPRAYWLQV